jgi:2-polyprenyl-3-methyl-5-hydroxy-6-metoxy-1,4-benzoquinol methylase
MTKMPRETAKISQDQWDRTWKDWNPEGAFTRFIKYRVANYTSLNYRMNIVFKKHLASGNKKLLDIGCGSGKWLIYFRRQFGFQVYGVDYSKSACKAAKESLTRNRVKGKIICADIFDVSFQSQYEEYFDIVTSMGVVEHFADPTEVIGIHLKLLKRGGNLIITIPNFGDGSLYRKIGKIFGREEELLRGHNVDLMKIPKFTEYVEQFKSLEIEKLDYVGPLNIIGIVPWRFGLQYGFYPLNELIGYATFFLSSETFSPLVILVARKD